MVWEKLTPFLFLLFLEIQRRYKHLILFHSNEKIVRDLFSLFFFLVNDNTDPWKANIGTFFFGLSKFRTWQTARCMKQSGLLFSCLFVHTGERKLLFEHLWGLMTHSLRFLVPPPRKHWTLLGTAPANVV